MKLEYKILNKLSLLLFIPIISIVSPNLLAQNLNEATSTELEEIVVTARKRAEGVLDVPLAISALSSDMIEKSNITSIEDIAANTPGLTFQSFNGGGLSSPVIRGLAQTDIASADNNVGVFLNGMFINGKSNIDISLLDIERVEVIKGPQSAMFGRNSFAGAINYVTKKPSDDFQGAITATVGTDELREVKANLSGALIPDKLLASFAVSTSEFDGTLDNGFGGEKLGGWDVKDSAAVTVNFMPTDRLSIDLFYYEGKTELDPTAGYIAENNCGGTVVTAFPRRGGSGGTYFCGELDFQDEYFVSSFAQNSVYETSKAALSLFYDFENAQLSFESSFGDYDFNGLSDQIYDESPDSDLTRNFVVPFVGPAEDESYELRLQSSSSSALQWLVGLYNFKGEFAQFSEVFSAFGGSLASGSGFIIRDRNDISDVNAVFGSVDYDFSDTITGSLELRYTEEEKIQESVNGFTGVLSTESEEFTFLTPRASLTWAHSENANLYASYASGVKSGGFNSTTFEPERTFDEESIDMFELGYKARLNDGKLNLSAATFFFSWDDLQFTAPTNDPNGFTNTTQNIGKADGWGVELSLNGLAGDNFEYRFGLAYTQPSFENNTLDVGSSRNCPDLTLPVSGCSTDVSGNNIPRISELQLNLGGTYNFTLGDSEFYISADITHESEKYARALQVQNFGENTLVNFRAGWLMYNWDVALWGKNITDEEYIRSSINEPEFGGFINTGFSATSSTFTTALPANTSSYGITAKYSF
ncbi:MAG: TonB-dependent receptor [Acidiferrobacterales bacterium]|nr:TonB-dependent receptor [Acidiferrobacterales bacterium]